MLALYLTLNCCNSVGVYLPSQGALVFAWRCPFSFVFHCTSCHLPWQGTLVSTHPSDRTRDLCLRARVADGIDARSWEARLMRSYSTVTISEQLIQSSTHARCQQVLKCTQVHTLSFAFLIQAAGLPFSMATHLQREGIWEIPPGTN